MIHFRSGSQISDVKYPTGTPRRHGGQWRQGLLQSHLGGCKLMTWSAVSASELLINQHVICYRHMGSNTFVFESINFKYFFKVFYFSIQFSIFISDGHTDVHINIKKYK